MIISRYHTSNLMCTNNIIVPTKLCPEGCLICVILVPVVCDKPAAHKISGFTSHSHTNFCTCCWISIASKDKVSAFEKGAFKVHTDAQHHKLGELYGNLTMPNAYKTFVKDFVTIYMQLWCLPYFNIVEQVIIDPMYNLFLGLMYHYLQP
ncbi:hypothetical protein DEU56DRAFT_873818 [Suillus clintonianus]|uniref:uncharacterized protein n=1 Tax=Suillus clintonianus TaxID=1904413 RepID=UPI001B8756FE|nr:uncharacterized protein DEU56DRAFT_873818 [Suillus clintonianus]KAG2121282.1 hypothetical protein DEU56DRAFT_873818 [Suillus clintonianus]